MRKNYYVIEDQNDRSVGPHDIIPDNQPIGMTGFSTASMSEAHYSFRRQCSINAKINGTRLTEFPACTTYTYQSHRRGWVKTGHYKAIKLSTLTDLGWSSMEIGLGVTDNHQTGKGR